MAGPGKAGWGLWVLMAGALWGGLEPGHALAYDYGVRVVIDSEEDLYELYATGDLSEDELNRLVALFQNKVDLNRAGVETLYELPGVGLKLGRAIVDRREALGRFKSLDDLKEVKGITPAMLEELAPFVVVRFRMNVNVPVTGSVKTKLGWARGEQAGLVDPSDPESLGGSYRPSQLGLGNLPMGYVRLRGDVAERVKLGAVAEGSEGIDRLAYDPNYNAIQVHWARPLLTLHKAYGMVDGTLWSAVVGSYEAGFGQRLVFDETRDENPKGISTDDSISGVGPFGAPQRLFGAGGSYRGLTFGKNTLELTAFLSRRAYDLSQYDLLQPGGGVDAESYPVYLDSLELMQQTLPNVYREQLAGANATMRLDKHTYIGVSGYWSKTTHDIPFEFGGTMPADRDSFGALGVTFGAALWQFQVNGEYALMDNLSQAVFVRGIWDLGPGEIVTSFRAYGTDYDNPHSRGFADADTYLGKRDRDEVGGYLQASYKFSNAFRARLSYNQWYRPSLSVWRNQFGTALEFRTRHLMISPSGQWKDKDLSVGGRGYSYASAVSAEDDPTTELPTVTEAYETGDITGQLSVVDEGSDEAQGSRGQLGLRVQLKALGPLTLTTYYRRSWTDAAQTYYSEDGGSSLGWLVGHDVWLKARYDLRKGTFLTARARYLDDDVYGEGGERALEGYLQWDQQVWRMKYSLRYTYTRGLAGHAYYDLEACGSAEDACCVPAVVEVAPTPVEDATHAVLATVEVKF